MPCERCCRFFCSLFCCCCSRPSAVAPQPVPRAVVIDNGSLTLKAGFAGDDEPRVVFPAVIGRPAANKMRMIALPDHKDIYVGHEAKEKRGLLNLEYPIRDGNVTSWDDLEKIWEHAFSKLNTNSSNQSVLLCGVPINSPEDQEKIEQIMFGKFEVPALYIEQQAVLSLYACGLTTGVAVNLGEGPFEAVPVHESRVITSAVQKAGLSGTDLTELLIRMLGDLGHRFTTSADMDIARDMKAKLCYVSPDFKNEMQTTDTPSSKETYRLPDEQTVTLGNQRFRCTEAMFDPTAVDQNGRGIPETTFDSIQKCEKRLHKDLFKNIVISGGNSLYKGFPERFRKELGAMVPSGTRLNVVTVTNKDLHRAWRGGSKMASSPSFMQKCLTKQMLEERKSM